MVQLCGDMLNSMVAQILECGDIVSFFKAAGYARSPDHRESSSPLRKYWTHYLEAMTAREMALLLKCFADDINISFVRTKRDAQLRNM